MTDHEDSFPTPPSSYTVTDKRGQGKTAESAGPVADGLSDEDQQLLEQQAADYQPPKTEGPQSVMAMFLVVVHNDGTSLATNDLDVTKYTPQIEPTSGVMYRACAEIMKDILVTDTAVTTVQFVNRQAQMAMQQAQAQQIQQRMPRGPRG